MALAYGYETAARDDSMVRIVISLVNLLAKALSPERAAVLSAFPIRTSSINDRSSVTAFSPPHSREASYVVSGSRL
jgi:hypothetical protein